MCEIGKASAIYLALSVLVFRVSKNILNSSTGISKTQMSVRQIRGGTGMCMNRISFELKNLVNFASNLMLEYVEGLLANMSYVLIY